MKQVFAVGHIRIGKTHQTKAQRPLNANLIVTVDSADNKVIRLAPVPGKEVRHD